MPVDKMAAGSATESGFDAQTPDLQAGIVNPRRAGVFCTRSIDIPESSAGSQKNT